MSDQLEQAGVEPGADGVDGTAFSTIEEALEDIRDGKMILVFDDADRENEGDFIVAAEM